MMTAHCKVLADEILADCSQNRQSVKINSPPKFPAIRLVISGWELQLNMDSTECGLVWGVWFARVFEEGALKLRIGL